MKLKEYLKKNKIILKLMLIKFIRIYSKKNKIKVPIFPLKIFLKNWKKFIKKFRDKKMKKNSLKFVIILYTIINLTKTLKNNLLLVLWLCS